MTLVKFLEALALLTLITAPAWAILLARILYWQSGQSMRDGDDYGPPAEWEHRCR